MTKNLEQTAGQLFPSKYGSARGGKKMKGGTKRYGATEPLMDDLANIGMGRGYVGISNAKDVCQGISQRGGGLDSSPFNGKGHRPILSNPGYGYVNPEDNDVLRGNLPQVNSYDQNACVGGGKKRKKRRKTNKRKTNKRKTNNRKNRKTNNRKTNNRKKCTCKKCKCSNKKKCNCKICKKKGCPCCKTTYTRKNRRTKRNNNVKRKNMYGCGLKGGNKYNQATYSYTGKNVSPQFANPLSVPNIDSKAYNHCFSEYKH